MNTTSKGRRYGILLMATAIFVLAASVVAKAAQTLTVPNAANYTYKLEAGASSSQITPVSNQAVLLLGSQTSAGYRGVATATILHVPKNFIEWEGIESPAGAVITQGYSSVAGTHILYLDYSHQVDVQVAGPDTILIHNANPNTQTGNLELIW